MAFYGLDPVMFEGVSAVTATPSVEVGTRRMDSGEEYVYCLNNTGSSVTQGALMVKSLSSLTRSSTASVDFPLVCVKHAAVPAANYFWGLVRGEALVMSAAITAGNLIGIGADGVINTYLVGSFPTGVCIGKALVTTAASSQPTCVLNLFG
jgi:hypothetical protein